jgi:hypothetical protein
LTKKIAFILFVLPIAVFAQIGGYSTYQFLDVPVSARSAAVGGRNISVVNGDMNVVEDNPALLSPQHTNNLSLNYINYISDINYGYVGYSNTLPKVGQFNVGMQYLNYGKFVRANYLGEQLGEFTAADYALNISYAKHFDSTYSVGGTVKHILSDYEKYESFGIAADLGAHYRAKNGLFTAGLVLNNMGAQLVGYRKGVNERLPFRIDFGISQRFGHAPIRVNVLFQQLQKWDLTYAGATGFQTDLSARDIADKMLRHLVIGAEILPSKNFTLSFAYDYNKRQELKLASRAGLSGISFGVGFKISKFSLSYGRSTYHLGGASNHLTIMTDLGDFKRNTRTFDEKD